MAKGLNKVMLIGNMTRDIEVRFTPSNQSVGNFGLALNRSWRTPEGELREEVTFVDCEAWGKSAEILKQYTSKGAPLFVEGRLKMDEWQDKTSGQKRTKMKVVVEDFRLMGAPRGGGGGAGAPGGEMPSAPDEYDQSPQPRPSAPARRGGAGSAPSAPAQPMGEEDIPF